MRRHAHVDFQLFLQKSSGIPGIIVVVVVLAAAVAAAVLLLFLLLLIQLPLQHNVLIL